MGLGKATIVFTKLPHQEWTLPVLPTFVVMGRSNVGKSSLLNALVHPQQIFRTGSTPGVTRGLVGASVEMGRKELFILDLPGWGYAARSGKEVNEWSDIGDRLTHEIHAPLTKVFWLIDPRRKPDPMDRTVFQWMSHFDWQVVFMKADQVVRKQRKAIEHEWEKVLGAESLTSLWASGKDGEGIPELIKKARTFVRELEELGQKLERDQNER